MAGATITNKISVTALLVNMNAVQSLNCLSNRAGATTNKISVTALLVNMDAVKSLNCVRNIVGVKFTITVITATSKIPTTAFSYLL